jgi:DNA transformation protein
VVDGRIVARTGPAISPFPDIEFMPKPTEFVTHVIETMRDFGAVRTKAMFGGWGFWRDEVFFALIVDDTLYFKTDAETRTQFESRGLVPFVFEKRKDGEAITTSYFVAPEEALENPREMLEWARLAYAAALRSGAKKKRKKN